MGIFSEVWGKLDVSMKTERVEGGETYGGSVD